MYSIKKNNKLLPKYKLISYKNVYDAPKSIAHPDK